jgi:cold shock CspA family protein
LDPNSGVDVYFHLGDFDPKGPWPGLDHTCPRSSPINFNWECPPPILGELVDVTYKGDNTLRANRVIRIDPPRLLHGLVDSFDPKHGYGFVRGSEDGVSYHLHQSEMIDGHFPQVGSNVVFFAGSRQGKPRAIHAHVCDFGS